MSKERWDVMMVKDGVNGGKAFWTKVGVAFTNKNGSINVQLDAFPVDGKIQLQIPLSKEEIEQKRAARENQGRGNSGQQQRFRQKSTPQKPVPQYEPNEDDSGEEGPF